jgi:hypothetical protein
VLGLVQLAVTIGIVLGNQFGRRTHPTLSTGATGSTLTTLAAGTAGTAACGPGNLSGLDVCPEGGALGFVQLAITVGIVLGNQFGRRTHPTLATGAAGTAPFGPGDLARLNVGVEGGAFGFVQLAVTVGIVLGDQFGRRTHPTLSAGAAGAAVTAVVCGLLGMEAEVEQDGHRCEGRNSVDVFHGSELF